MTVRMMVGMMVMMMVMVMDISGLYQINGEVFILPLEVVVVVVVINLFSELIIAFPEKRSVQYVQYN